MTDPEAAADELERGVRDLGLCGALINGTAGGLFLDDAAFAPLLARAASLDVPLYLHPSLPPNAVLDAYYGDLPGHAGFLLAGPGFGWHAERSEEHTSELQSLMRISYAVFCLKKKNTKH